ncbi:MAG: DUF6325 family protein [Candidatus Nanopelagicales bacterium]|jgi:hypothetical protein|nr:DUF6325 family protein [Actinomycetota bacterium]MDA9350267.1 DUF6325 family protein [Actinomycetota bacterium]MDB0039437.1 DUF6325 family protein [Actinomycetota bacterium]MDB9921280.1 DUF6325 family protein [Actinomycetota bacterium]MDC0654965.1 DUF6325 family protein [bacterium]
MSNGPIEVLVLGFPGNEFSGEILPELARLVAGGQIAILDLKFVAKALDGQVVTLEAVDAGNEEWAELIVSDSADYVEDEDFQDVADMLEPGSSAAILVFEHLWAKSLTSALIGAGGVLLFNARIPAE